MSARSPYELYERHRVRSLGNAPRLRSALASTTMPPSPISFQTSSNRSSCRQRGNTTASRSASWSPHPRRLKLRVRTPPSSSKIVRWKMGATTVSRSAPFVYRLLPCRWLAQKASGSAGAGRCVRFCSARSALPRSTSYGARTHGRHQGVNYGRHQYPAVARTNGQSERTLVFAALIIWESSYLIRATSELICGHQGQSELAT